MTGAMAITQALGGLWNGRKGLVKCVAHDDATPSLLLSDGPAGVQVHCLAGCDWKAVKDELKARGLLNGTYTPPDPAQLELDRKQANKDRRDREALCLRLWSQARPVAGTLAETYLNGRAIAPPYPATLRFHHALRHPDGTNGPAMLSALARWPSRELCGLSRLFLTADGQKAGRMDLGTKRGAAVRLSALAEDGVLYLCEGVEDGLSVASIVGHDAAVWACLGVRNLADVEIPDEAREVVIAADNDRPGRIAAERAFAHWSKAGRKVSMIWPPDGLKDWNEAAQAMPAKALGYV